MAYADGGNVDEHTMDAADAPAVDATKPAAGATGTAAKPAKPKPTPAELKQVSQLISTIKSDKKFHEKAFKNMRRDMFVAMHGREETWSEKNYKANIAGRHVKQKTAGLYAKNPKATAARAERLDFAIWDETPDTLLAAFATIQQAMAVTAAHQQATQAQGELAAQMPAPNPLDPAMGHNGGPPLDPLPPPQLPPGFEEAQALVADFQQGMERRKLYDKVGKTLEVLYAKALREQKPVDFRTAMKQLVRRTCTTSVGYVEAGFQREYGPRPAMTERLADARGRIDHLRVLSEKVADNEIESIDAEMAELNEAVAALQAEEEIVVREGLILDFPSSTKVIPDKLCKKLVGFIGARHVTLEYDFTVDEVREMFDVEIDKYTPHTADGKTFDSVAGDDFDEDGDFVSAERKGTGLVRVWKQYDKPSGLVYYVADGYPCFLRPAAAPDVFVEDFWPLYALTFNDVESEKELFPPSDVALLLDMQREHNRARQGKREHRDAARPRWAYAKSAINEEDAKTLGTVKPFEAVGLDIDPATELAKVLQSFPVPGVDPNLYDTGEVSNDMQLVVGAQEAQMGGISKATATETAISANSSASSDGSSVDDLDAFLTVLARACGQILFGEMSEEQVKLTVGPGAVWPHMSLSEIAEEVFLEVEAGSSGKPNRAVEIDNWNKMLPMLLQMPGIKPVWLAKETLKRLDDRMDLTDALSEGLPSIASQNQAPPPVPGGDPANDPNAQGPKGANNAPAPTGAQPGSEPAFGSNQM